MSRTLLPPRTVRYSAARFSNGRAYLRIGAVWNEGEARDFGAEFGASPGERLRWLGEALAVMRDMLHGKPASASGLNYGVNDARNDPRPVQEYMPSLIGGSGGENATLGLVARYAYANNIGLATGLEGFLRKESGVAPALRGAGSGRARDRAHAQHGPIIIRDSNEEAARVLAGIYDHNGGAKTWAEGPQQRSRPDHPSTSSRCSVPSSRRATGMSSLVCPRRTTRRPWSG